jgi:hypothetical protein
MSKPIRRDPNRKAQERLGLRERSAIWATNGTILYQSHSLVEDLPKNKPVVCRRRS